MYFLYSFLLTIGVIALLPRLIYDAFRHGKYVAGLRERLGLLPLIKTNGRAVIWLHCVSVGEAQAARPLARAILNHYPSHALIVSTTTLTGQRVARAVFRDDAAAIIYFPFDWRWAVRRALRTVNPAAALIMETELWPNFLRECRRRRVPVALVNGRLSERSFRRYKLIRRFSRRFVNDLELALMQTNADAGRMRALGLAPERVLVSGNVKFDVGAEVEDLRLTDELRERFSFTDGRALIVAASTHSTEERIILEAFVRLRALRPANGKVRLLIAPRHPERFAEVASLLESSGLRWSRRSGARSEEDSYCDVLLLDSIGELRAVYPLADIVFIGGSLTPTGGHNILEPAAFGVCTVTGAHTFNFKAIVESFLEADALLQLEALAEKEEPAALSNLFQGLLENDERRRALGENARAVLLKNRGATARTIKMLAPILASTTEKSEQPRPQSARHGALSA